MVYFARNITIIFRGGGNYFEVFFISVLKYGSNICFYKGEAYFKSVN